MVTTTTSPRSREPAAVVERLAAGAEHERAAVDPEQHRPARASRPRGVYTFRYRQSSLSGSGTDARDEPPSEPATRTAKGARRSHARPGLGGSGARKRNLPVGGFANGIPRNTRCAPRRVTFEQAAIASVLVPSGLLGAGRRPHAASRLLGRASSVRSAPASCPPPAHAAA